ncbi:tetratricopeptide repeat protein [Phormidesmis sp. 146-12]
MNLIRLLLTLTPSFAAQSAAAESQKPQADQLFQQGNQLSDQGKFREALPVFQQALKIRQKLSDRVGEADTLNAIALTHQQLNQLDAALQTYQQALLIYRKEKRPLLEAYVLGSIASIYRDLNQPEAALTAFEQARSLFRSENKPQQETRTLLSIGLTVYRSAKPDRLQLALAAGQQALEIAKTLEKSALGDQAQFLKGQALTLIGLAYMAENQFEPAIDSRKQAIASFQTIKGALSKLFKTEAQKPRSLPFGQ